MKAFASLLILCLSVGFSSVARAEIINHVPGFHLYQASSKLAADLGEDGVSMLCFPASLAHLLIYQRSIRTPSFPTLLWPKSDNNHDQRINGFDLIHNLKWRCRTQKNSGTWYADGINCSQDFYHDSGFTSPLVETIGRNSRTGNKTLTLTHIRNWMKKDAGVIMLIGWYNRNDGRWIRDGGHFVNLYGYEYDTATRPNNMTLYVVNPLVNYIGRTKAQMFDRVKLSPLKNAGNLSKYGEVYQLSGKGFNLKAGWVGVLEDILVLSPTL